MYSSALSALSAEQRQVLLTDAPLLTLPAVFATIPDPRSKHGQRYDLPYLLFCLTAALRVFLQFDRGRWTMVSRAARSLTALVRATSASQPHSVPLSLASSPPLQPADRMDAGALGTRHLDCG
jgi:hypothetical protein